MVQLYLLRHAKSDWGAGLPDHDRPLNGRGRKAAAAIGREMAARGIAPDLVICSTAKRARETLERTVKAGDLEVEVQYEPALYLAGVDTILRTVRRDAGNCQSVLLVGHNPGFHGTALELASSGPDAEMHTLQMKYPTGALCAVSFDGDTIADIDFSEGKLDFFLRPRDLL